MTTPPDVRPDDTARGAATIPAQRGRGPARRGRNPSRRGTFAVAAGLAVLVAGGGAAVVAGLMGDDAGGAGPSAAAGAQPGQGSGPDAGQGAAVTGPLEVPEELGGVRAVPAAQDIGLTPGWREVATKQVGDAELVTRQYGTAADRRYVRLVAARTDLTGKLELGWAADAGTVHGDYRCTQDVAPPGGTPGVRKTVLLCWRATPGLSVYSLAIDFDAAPRPEAVLPALQQLWATAQG